MTDRREGEVIGGRYRLVKLLGEGGMGRVYLAEQRMGSSTRRVAIKMLLPELSERRDVVTRFMRECAVVSELEHPNTIRVFDFGENETGELYVVMEYVSGRSLGVVMVEEGPLPPGRVDHIMAQLCASLAEAHDKGIVHRDLKPENLLITSRAGEDDFVKVLDFGIARKVDAATSRETPRLTMRGVILGTPPYMSPEQFGGGEDARSDIYALGVIAYQALTGTLPFDADTMLQWQIQHRTAEPRAFDATPAGARVPEKMRRAVLRALSKRPEDRPSSTRAFYEELSVLTAPSSAAGASHRLPTTEIGTPVFDASRPLPATVPGMGSTPPVAMRHEAKRSSGVIAAIVGALVIAASGVALAWLVIASREPDPLLRDDTPPAARAPVSTSPKAESSTASAPKPSEDARPPSASTPVPPTTQKPPPSSPPPAVSTPSVPPSASPTASAPPPPVPPPSVTVPPSATAPPSATVPPSAPPAPLPPPAQPPPREPRASGCAAVINASTCRPASSAMERCPVSDPLHAAAHARLDRLCDPERVRRERRRIPRAPRPRN